MDMSPIDPAIQAVLDDLGRDVDSLRRENAELRHENEELRKRVAELEERLARYEGTPPPEPTDPSTPSGMMPPYKKGNSSGKKKKKPGRKKGHKGARRASAEPNNHVHHTVDSCPDCGGNLEDEPVVSTRTRITEDIAAPSDPEVTGNDVDSKWCPNCKKRVEAKVDAALPHCTLGLRVMLLTAWMHYAMGTSTHAVVRYLQRVHRFSVTAGGLTQAWKVLTKALAPMYDAIWHEILASGVLYADETGWRVDGRTSWLWCFTTKQAVYYVIDRTRGSPVVLRVLGESFKGVLVSDFYAAYGFVCAAAKQKCLAHLLRELEKVSLTNSAGEWQDFAKRTKRLIKDALRLGVTRNDKSDEEYDRLWKRLYDRLSCIHDAEYSDKDCKRMARRLKKFREELFTFLERDNVDATNNHGERIIRPAVLMRKNYYGNRSESGASVQATLMSIFRTLEMKGVDPLQYLENALRANLRKNAELTLPSLSVHIAA
jgi:transposase